MLSLCKSFVPSYGYLFMWIYHILVIDSSVGEHLGCFYSLAFKNNAALNICVQDFV